MWDFLIMLLVCSVTMSMITACLIVFSSLLSKRYRTKWLYYAWVIAFLGFAIPIRPRIDFGFINQIPNIYISPNNTPILDQLIKSGEEIKNSSGVSFNMDFIFAIWLIGFSLVIIMQIIRHMQFIKMVNRWKENISNEQVITITEMLATEIGIAKKAIVQVCPCT